MKKDNLNIIETFNTYKEDFKKMNEDIKKLEKNIENLIIQKIKVLFEEQKQINENMIKLKEEYDDILNNKIKNIILEQMKNFIKDNNSKEIHNITNNTTLYKNGANSVENINIKDNSNILNIKSSRKLNVLKNMDNKNNSSKNLLNNKDIVNNKQNLFIFSKNTSSLNSPQNINGNMIEKKINRKNSHGKTMHYDIVTKKNIIDNLNNNKVNYSNLLNINKINDNILLNIKNDNILIAKKTQFPISKHGHKRSLINDTKKKIVGYFEPYGNKYTIFSRNMKKYKIKNKSEDNNEIENDLDFNEYIKILNFKNKKSLKRRRSYDKIENENLEKFQKLLKIDINDVDAKLNNLNNSSSSFELFNEGQEINDPFVDANIIIKNNNSKNDQSNNDKNNININFTKLNILSKPIKIINNDNDINEFGKNLIASKTSSDINIFESNKKDKSDFEINPINIKNKKIFQTSKKDEHKVIFMKKTNSDVLNLRKNLKNKTQSGFHPKIRRNHGFKQMNDSNNDFHNHFIGFDMDNSEKKIKKGKKK
jgi:hypothetical protein